MTIDEIEKKIERAIIYRRQAKEAAKEIGKDIQSYANSERIDKFSRNLLGLLQEFHERVLHNEDYPYSTLGLAEWLEFEKLKPAELSKPQEGWGDE